MESYSHGDKDKTYTTSDGKITFTSEQAVHAIKHFHEVVDLDRTYEVPYMLGIMGGCFAHACNWSAEFIDELENSEEPPRELYAIWARMISAYFTARSAGIFVDGVNPAFSLKDLS